MKAGSVKLWTPVQQTLFGDGKGNCFAASVASVVGVPLADVPNFCVDYGDQWFEKLRSWCAARQIQVMFFELPTEDQVNGFLEWTQHIDIPFIVGGFNAAGVGHVHVYHRGVKVHDTNPNGVELTSIVEAYFLVRAPLREAA